MIILLVLSSTVDRRYIDFNRIFSIESGDFTGLDSLTILSAIAMPIGIIVLAHVQFVGT